MRQGLSEILEKLNKLCKLHGWTPSRLVYEAVKRQYARWDELSKLVMIPLKEGEVEMGPWGAGTIDAVKVHRPRECY